MNKLEDIQIQKHRIEREKEELEYTQRGLQQIEEDYEAYFSHQKKLFDNLQEEFADSQTAMVYQDMRHQIHWQSRGIQDFLNEQQHELKKQVTVLEDKENELAWQERRIAMEEKEG
jgi:hypothetical protein